MRRMVKVNSIGASAFQVMILASCLHARHFGWILALTLVRQAANPWITLVLLKKREATQVESLRFAMNLGVSLVVSHLGGWPLAVWFLFPFAALAFDGFTPLLAWTMVGLYSVVIDAAAILDGVGWVTPAAFTVLAAFCRLVTETRLEVLRDMVRSSELQRAELDAAHAGLVAANQKLVLEIDARAKAEVDLRQAQKLEAVGRLASGIAHEINTPLQFIGDSVHFVDEALRDGTELGSADRPSETRAEARDALQLALEGISRVSAIVVGMREFAHSRQGERATIDLNRAVHVSLNVARHEYRYVADVELDLAEGLPHISCFGGEIHQVILNLLVNAAHAIEDRHGHERGTIRLATRREGDEIVLSVGDTGVGIPEAIRDRIFDPFFTTKDVGRGTGQGLAIARSIVERHHGTLTFESRPGEGTTFLLRLPIEARETSHDERRVA